MTRYDLIECDIADFVVRSLEYHLATFLRYLHAVECHDESLVAADGVSAGMVVENQHRFVLLAGRKEQEAHKSEEKAETFHILIFLMFFPE